MPELVPILLACLAPLHTMTVLTPTHRKRGMSVSVFFSFIEKLTRAWKQKSSFIVAKKVAAARPHSWALGLDPQFPSTRSRVQSGSTHDFGPLSGDVLCLGRTWVFSGFDSLSSRFRLSRMEDVFMWHDGMKRRRGGEQAEWRE